MAINSCLNFLPIPLKSTNDSGAFWPESTYIAVRQRCANLGDDLLRWRKFMVINGFLCGLKSHVSTWYPNLLRYLARVKISQLNEIVGYHMVLPTLTLPALTNFHYHLRQSLLRYPNWKILRSSHSFPQRMRDRNQGISCLGDQDDPRPHQGLLSLLPYRDCHI